MREFFLESLPGILHLERAQGMSGLHLLIHSNYSGPEFHPDSRRGEQYVNQLISYMN